MTIRVGINGFGRIGRCVMRIAAQDPEVEVVAVNIHSNQDAAIHLLKFDSVHGRFPGVERTEDGFTVNGTPVKVVSGDSPADIEWGELGCDLVIESTGKFKGKAECQAFLDKGAKKVLITAPGKEDVDATIVMGVNDEIYDPATMNVVSNASCTTNCLAPVAKVLDQAFGIERGYMNTIHAYTGDQRIVDKTHKDLRRARAGAVSQIPTTTGAAKAVGLVLPQLAGKLDGMSTRVPVPDGSMVDLTAQLKTQVTAEQINEAMKAAAEGPMKGVLEYSTDPLVSCDIIGDTASSIFDSQLTRVMGGTGDFIKVISWYDNEMGYSARVVDLAKLMLA
ncbi:MAG: type I glyceraldehyde-3-phosphate dehydrogenase [Coriobacteriales bacterium]|nr:type I glyceraldehyde-3-phosphate dehydrogenase [Coriobacteriales bacterium]